jgi:TonB family protein
MSRYDEAKQIAEIAAASPHINRGVNYNSRASEFSRRVDEARRQAEARRLAEIRAEVAVRVAEREPPPPPPPPPPPERFGEIQYEVQSRTLTEVLTAVLPSYPDALVQKGVSGSITLQVTVGVDGRVSAASIAGSKIPEMNASTLDSVRKWTFRPAPAVSGGKPAAFNLTLIVHFRVQ